MTDKLTPPAALQLIRILANIDWRPMKDSDRDVFADSGPDAQCAILNAAQHSQVAELLDFRAPAEFGIMAVIGGDALQLELHSINEYGSPIWICIPIGFETN